MTDTVTVDNGTLTDYVVASDDAGVAGQVQIVKLAEGADGSAATLPATQANGLMVDVSRIVPGVGATSLGKAEDSVAGNADTGVAVLAVRRDAAASGVSADGDYAMLSVDANGALRITSTGGAGTQQYAEDAAAVSGDLGTLALAVRRDTPSAGVSADGDYAAMSVDANGALRVATDPITNPAGALTVKRAFANVAASSTDSVIVAGVSTKKLRILAMIAVAGATATNLTPKSKPVGAGSAIGPAIANAANGGEVLPWNPGGWFETVAGEGFAVDTGAGATTGIHVVYVEA